MLFLIRFFSLLPLAVLYGLADYLLYPLLRYVLRYRLRVVRKNISLSFPQKSPAEQAQIVSDFYHHFSSVLVEIVYGYRASAEEMRERVYFENMEVLEDLARKRHGVVAYLGHVCNWEWIADVGNQFVDKQIVEYNVYRRLKSASADRAMLALRLKRGGECVEKNMLLRHLVGLRHASHPFVLGFLADQKPSARSSAVWTQFLGQDTAFLSGGEVLARKFGLGVVYVHITTAKRGYYRVRFQVIADDVNALPENEVTLAYARCLEQNIRECPHRWLWSHNRWKWSRLQTE